MPTDEEITDAIASEVCARIGACHPLASPAFIRTLVRLYTAQAVGTAPPPGRISERELAAWLDLSRHSVSRASKQGLARAWQAYHAQCPHLLGQKH